MSSDPTSDLLRRPTEGTEDATEFFDAQDYNSSEARSNTEESTSKGGDERNSERISERISELERVYDDSRSDKIVVSECPVHSHFPGNVHAHLSPSINPFIDNSLPYPLTQNESQSSVLLSESNASIRGGSNQMTAPNLTPNLLNLSSHALHFAASESPSSMSSTWPSKLSEDRVSAARALATAQQTISERFGADVDNPMRAPERISHHGQRAPEADVMVMSPKMGHPNKTCRHFKVTEESDPVGPSIEKSEQPSEEFVQFKNLDTGEVRLLPLELIGDRRETQQEGKRDDSNFLDLFNADSETYQKLQQHLERLGRKQRKDKDDEDDDDSSDDESSDEDTNSIEQNRTWTLRGRIELR